MAKPYIHAVSSSKKFGGDPEDYLAIHDFMDSSKAHVPDVRHRAVLHSSFGIYIAEQVFGTYITNSKGRKVQVRDVAEQHVLEDLGTIPTLQDYLKHMKLEKWMGGPKRTRKTISFDGEEQLVDTESKEAEAEAEEKKELTRPTRGISRRGRDTRYID